MSEALVKIKSIELRGLSLSERREAVRDSMAVREAALWHDRAVLLVDDVTRSGATLAEAARLLRTHGAKDVLAVTLSHVEG